MSIKFHNLLIMKYNPKYTDFTLICLDGKVEVHRVILSSKLSFWNDFFDNDLDCKSINVPFCKDGVLEFIKYYYDFFDYNSNVDFYFKHVDSILFGDFSGHKFYFIDLECDIDLDETQKRKLFNFISRTNVYIGEDIEKYITLEELRNEDYFLIRNKYVGLDEIFYDLEYSDDEGYNLIMDFISKYPPKEPVSVKIDTEELVNRFINIPFNYESVFLFTIDHKLRHLIK